MLANKRAKLAWALVVLGVSLATGGCGGAGAQNLGPREVLRQYAIALEQGHLQQAYALLSDEAKRDLGPGQFADLVRLNPEEAARIGRALRAPAGPPEITARMLTPSGQQLHMVYQDGLWKVDGSLLDRYGQDTPRQAVTGFVRAFRNKRYDMLLRYAPRAERTVDASGSWGRAEGEPPGEMSEAVLKKAWEGPQKNEMERLIEAIEAALPNARIEQSGERAVMPYGSEGTVLLVREDGRWKVEDL